MCGDGQEITQGYGELLTGLVLSFGAAWCRREVMSHPLRCAHSRDSQEGHTSSETPRISTRCRDGRKSSSRSRAWCHEAIQSERCGHLSGYWVVTD
jgi:hypothetical protein